MGKLEDLLALAESQVGYTEKDNDTDLNTKVGSTAGDGNHTKFAKELEKMGLPGYCGSAWCASYQMWLEVKAVGKEQALKNMGPQFYNCFAVRDYAKAQKRWLEPSASPKPGYLVIFKQSHIARVIKVAANKIYTNEGNTSNGTAIVRNGGMVCNKSYDRSNGNILGYVRMEYAAPITYTEGFLPAADGKCWWYQYKDGSFTKGGWYWLTESSTGTSGWYLFDDAGYMLTGYQTDNAGESFFLCPEKGINEGKCMVTDARGVLKIVGKYDFEKREYIV